LTYKEKQIMETLSFILGIASVVVIATAIVAVYAFVKVNKVQIRVNDQEMSLSREIENIHRIVNEEIQNISRHIENVERDIYSQMDSRFDRLENKLTSKKQLLKD